MKNDDFDEAPELTEELLKKAKPLMEDPKLAPIVTRGRPKADKPKVRVTMRLDARVVEHFKAGGRGWQTRMNEALKKAIA